MKSPDIPGRCKQRADTLVQTALTDGEAWIQRCGHPPADPARQDRWRAAARVVAAYRELHSITATDPLGPMPSTDRQRIDYQRALRAVRATRALTSVRDAALLAPEATGHQLTGR